jgi:hypothetical protein
MHSSELIAQLKVKLEKLGSLLDDKESWQKSDSDFFADLSESIDDYFEFLQIHKISVHSDYQRYRRYGRIFLENLQDIQKMIAREKSRTIRYAIEQKMWSGHYFNTKDEFTVLSAYLWVQRDMIDSQQFEMLTLPAFQHQISLYQTQYSNGFFGVFLLQKLEIPKFNFQAFQDLLIQSYPDAFSAWVYVGDMDDAISYIEQISSNRSFQNIFYSRELSFFEFIHAAEGGRNHLLLIPDSREWILHFTDQGIFEITLHCNADLAKKVNQFFITNNPAKPRL